MNLVVLLSEKQSDILARWLQAIFETYPPETARFLKREKDQFANPVGHALARGTSMILNYLLKEGETGEVEQALDDIIRIKAVQDFSPAQAIDFLFQLKTVVREEADADIRANRIPVGELLEFESGIDRLVLHAFNIFEKCREKIYELRANQVQNRTIRLLKRANLIVEFPDSEEGSGDVKKSK